MIGRIYRLMDTKRIEMKQREVKIDSTTVLVRPEYMSICAADQRYYLGQRKRAVLNKKLPMALIHEATGIVIRDYCDRFKPGEKVVLIPLDEGKDDKIKGNYRLDSRFASSGTDGFMRDIIPMRAEQLISVSGSYSVIYVFTEILSVALGAIEAFENSRQIDVDSFGVWGDGSIGFVTALALRCKYPQSKIYVFGKSMRKLQIFSFATKILFVDDITDEIAVSHAFECVGGRKSEDALLQILDIISPQGTINLLGVSENPISVDTRRVLEKGLVMIGHSRSDKKDFGKAVDLINNNNICRRYLRLLISQIIDINTADDITSAFEQNVLNDFKTVLKWNI